MSELSVIRAEDEMIPVFARHIGSWQFSLRRRPLSGPQLAKLYDRAAPGWARLLDRLGVPAAYEGLLQGLLRDEPIRPAASRLRVLDCGVGTGALSSALARVLSEPFDLEGVDISPGMLERAGERLRDAGISANLRRADLRDLPYSAGDFDLVMTGHVLEHLPDPITAIDEMLRVLRPGGLLVACITRRSLLGNLVHLKWRTHRVTPAEAERWFQDRGLDKARITWLEQNLICRQLSLACVGRKSL